MKIISDRTNDNGGDGYLSFELDGYFYAVGNLDDEIFYIQRQKIEDYEQDLDNWEEPDWKKVGMNFKLLK